MNFEIACPNNHKQTVSFTQVEFHIAVEPGLRIATPIRRQPMTSFQNLIKRSRGGCGDMGTQQGRVVLTRESASSYKTTALAQRSRPVVELSNSGRFGGILEL